MVRDFHTKSFQHKVNPLVLVLPPNVKEQDNLFVRLAKGKIPQAMAYLNGVYKGFDAGNPVEYHFLDQNYARQYQSEEKQGNLALMFTILAMLLSLVGLFGLVSFTAQQLTREIGIRKVLGASLYNIINLLSAGYMKLIAVAACIAVPLSWYIMYAWLSDFAYRIPLQFGVFIGAGFFSALLALVIVGLRGLNAGRANPIQAVTDIIPAGRQKTKPGLNKMTIKSGCIKKTGAGRSVSQLHAIFPVIQFFTIDSDECFVVRACQSSSGIICPSETKPAICKCFHRRRFDIGQITPAQECHAIVYSQIRIGAPDRILYIIGEGLIITCYVCDG